jgi:hypothetical protein
VFCHQTFEGSIGESGHALKGIPLNVFPKDCTSVISGDIHNPHSLGTVTYTGAPYTIDFGDNYRGRVILIDGENPRSIRVDGCVPQKRLLDADDDAKIIQAPEEMKKGDILKIRVRLSQFNPDRWAQLKAKIYAWADKNGYEIYQAQPIFDRGTKTAAKRKNYAVKSDKEVLDEYCKRRQVSAEVARTGQWLMQQK